MIKHPLTEATFFVGFAISSLLVQSWIGWTIHGIIILGIILFQTISIANILHRIRHMIWFFPILLGMFLLSSIIFSNISFISAVKSGIFSMMRFVLSTVIMGAFLEKECRKNIFQAIRSIWLIAGKSWHKVEDFFLFLSLTLRFFPSLQRQWSQLQSSKVSLGIQDTESRFSQVNSLMSDLPGFLIQQLKMADTTSLAMSLRGYGNQVPRGVAQFIPFRKTDGLQIAFLITFIIVIHRFASI